MQEYYRRLWFFQILPCVILSVELVFQKCDFYIVKWYDFQLKLMHIMPPIVVVRSVIAIAMD